MSQLTHADKLRREFLWPITPFAPEDAYMTNTLDVMTIIIRVASSHLDNAPPCDSSNPLVAFALSTGAADPLTMSAYKELVTAVGDKLEFGPNTSLAELMENPVMVSTFWDRPGFRRFGPQAYEGQLVEGQMQWKARSRPVVSQACQVLNCDNPTNTPFF